MKSSGVGYLLWLLCLLGLCGIHRLYAGKYVSGVIWLFTLGLLGIGQLVDLLLIPGMISNANLRFMAMAGFQNRNNNVNNVFVNVHVPTAPMPGVPPPQYQHSGNR